MRKRRIVCDWSKRILVLNLKGQSTMPDIRDIYRTPLLSAKTLAKNTITSEISAVYVETNKGDNGQPKDQVIIELEEGEVRIALNKGNALQLAEKFGRDYTEWQGKKVKVTTKPTTFMGKPTMGLQVVPVK